MFFIIVALPTIAIIGHSFVICGVMKLEKISQVRLVHIIYKDYRKISNISRTKSPNLDVFRLVLQLSLPNPMKPGVKSRMKK